MNIATLPAVGGEGCSASMSDGDGFASTAAPTENRLALVGGVIALIAAGPILNAQRPERPQEVKVPGIDVSLKAGWQLLFHEGCRFAVPGSWHAAGDAGLVRAPDGSNLSIRMFRVTSWSAHKDQIKAAFGHVRVMHEDSDRRLWFEIGETPAVQHYVDVASGLSVCSGLLEVRPSMADADDTTRRIVDSIAPVPDKWPPRE